MELIDLENNYFLVRFNNDGDYHYVFEEGPWMITDHYLVVQCWRPEFFPKDDTPKCILVWVHIPGLPIEYYDKNLL